MRATDLDLEFEHFFESGQRMTDAADVLLFARTSESRGHGSEALQLYVWTSELLDECPPHAEIEELRFEVDCAVMRLRRRFGPLHEEPHEFAQVAE